MRELSPAVADLLKFMAQQPLPNFEGRSADEVREMLARTAPPQSDIAIAEVRGVKIPVSGGDVRGRLYNDRPGQGPAPTLVFLHGGGWVACDIDTHDALCRALAKVSGWAVLSVEYRLAPEFPFPIPLEDAACAVRFVAREGDVLGLDASKLVVAGDSAGGNLAASLALMVRAPGEPQLRAQILLYPVIDRDFERISYVENGEGYLLTRDMMQWFWTQYVGPATLPLDPRAAPIRHADLSGAAPALIVLSGFDPLLDEGAAYAQALRDHGVEVETLSYDGQIHGFMSMDFFSETQDAIAKVGDYLRAIA